MVDACTFCTLTFSGGDRVWPLPPQGSSMAKQISAPYIECSAQQSENSVRDIFHVATLACINKNNKNVKRSKATRGNKRISHMPGRPDLAAVASDLRKDKAKSCSVMWLIRLRRCRLRMRTEHSASRKLRGNAHSCMLKTPYLSGKGFYKLQLMYMLLEYSAPMKSQCIVAPQSIWPPAPPNEEAICQWATCSRKWPTSSGRTKRMRSRLSTVTGNEQEKWCH